MVNSRFSTQLPRRVLARSEGKSFQIDWIRQAKRGEDIELVERSSTGVFSAKIFLDGGRRGIFASKVDDGDEQTNKKEVGDSQENKEDAVETKEDEQDDDRDDQEDESEGQTKTMKKNSTNKENTVLQ
ncbi:hypothetical protein FRX31_024089 [Thalictrum thalictroides]|uniref:Uncharacterized protein n=1 Tax=Thalictrum thalictroides TaxID=46969 RepID=A0A7J6VMJ9_THATH|nr:hypothetical protein FRX31_024089 [Thalictrum thalictroides]